MTALECNSRNADVEAKIMAMSEGEFDAFIGEHRKRNQTSTGFLLRSLWAKKWLCAHPDPDAIFGWPAPESSKLPFFTGLL